jgi:uncharacterized protein YcfJ
MEHRRSMLVEHSLGIARRAAGVAEAAGVALVSLGPRIVAVLGAEPVVEITLEADEMLDGFNRSMSGANAAS